MARAGAGPPPIPNKELSAEKLAAGITKCLESNTLARAQELGEKIKSEQGTSVGADSFHARLGVDSLRYAVMPDRAAIWLVTYSKIKLSAFAVAVLVDGGYLDFRDLRLCRSREYDSEDAPWDPISGILAATMGTTGELMMGVADFPKGMVQGALRMKPSRHSIRTDQSVQSHQGSLPDKSISSSMAMTLSAR